ncbi:MAG: hypothetical protein UV02_C0012G0021 [Candidatus Kuenenbacteria bacterium GW2011_GWA2_42_15]|uniref:Uncharacterized protein n=3 Tax=Candidatus Kueneniibacteriota TaxID=1752740 RepID=A0A0G1BYN1_9BACT|nr:MAG: hypothetical protein UV02_C0012G0021 [Candidatus Kuenenbacteria bacterium GW2011_GWA2_42_15]OGG90227.1 MAG: hypothetical protein A3H55_01895 [Candidatus Kuenenbacteria bacterium RIFCSPLOWO2_02_FULL_42_16]OGG95632.1 MAG: hypothetical protein A2V95_03210 [Candidatus Kuenenbacteria bacterium RBG_16_41_7]
MSLPSQKTIDQYLEGLKIDESRKEKILLVITHVVYKRNQNVIGAEAERDSAKRAQFLRSVEEYDQIIRQEIEKVLKGEKPQPYEF